MYGDSLQHFLVAIIHPNMDQAKKFGLEKGMSELDDVMKNPEFIAHVVADMDSKAREQNLTSLEKIKKIYLTSEAFSVANDLITPTFKIKRNIAKKVF